MKYILRLLVLAAATYFSVVNPPIFSIGYLKCDLILILLCIYSLYYGQEFVYLAFFAAGLTVDAASGGIMGVHSLFYTLNIFAVGLIKKYIYRENMNFQAIIILLSSFIYRIFDTAFHFNQSGSAGSIVFNCILTPLYTTALFAVFRILAYEASGVRRKNEAKKQPV